MDLNQVAHALRALAAAIEAPTPQALTHDQAAATQRGDLNLQATAEKKPRGRPVKGEAVAASSPPVASVAAPTSSAPTSSAAPAPTSAGAAANLTHAIVAKDFTAAGAAHGREFVVGLMKQYAKGATFDTVPAELLGKFQAALRAGPQKAADPVADLLG